MKRLLMTALLASQVAPAAAAGFGPTGGTDAGAFAGLRLRVQIDGDESQPRVRAGLAIAPALRTRDRQGEAHTRIGEGVELGFADGEPVRLSIAGTPVSQLTAGAGAPEGPKAGVSTLGWIAIGVGALFVVGLTAGYLFVEDVLDCDPDEECN